MRDERLAGGGRHERRERMVVHEARDRRAIARRRSGRGRRGSPRGVPAQCRAEPGGAECASAGRRVRRRTARARPRRRTCSWRLQNSQVTPIIPCSARMLSTSARPIIRSALRDALLEQPHAKRAVARRTARTSSSGKCACSSVGAPARASSARGGSASTRARGARPRGVVRRRRRPAAAAAAGRARAARRSRAPAGCRSARRCVR